MFSKCRNHLQDLSLSITKQRQQSPATFNRKPLYEAAIPYHTITTKTFLASPNVVVQSVTVAQKPKFIVVDLSQTQSVPNFKISLHTTHGFPSKLPEDRADEIMFKFV